MPCVDTLCIDTCGPYLLLALGHAARLDAFHYEERKTGHAEAIIPALEALSARGAPAAFTRIAVTIGPGSFTGLRVGLAVAKARALTDRCNLIPINRLQLLAMAAQLTAKPDASVSVAIDARRDEHFVQRFNPSIEAITQAFTLPNEAVPGWLEETQEDAVIVTSQTQLAPSNLAQAMVLLSHRSPEVDQSEIKPLYVRPPDAKMPKPSRFTLV